MENAKYLSAKNITKIYDITSATLRNWAELGKISCVRPNGKRLYLLTDILKIFDQKKAWHQTHQPERLPG